MPIVTASTLHLSTPNDEFRDIFCALDQPLGSDDTGWGRTNGEGCRNKMIEALALGE